MLLDGINHIALITNDAERLHAFYSEVFDATIRPQFNERPGVRMSNINLGPHTEFNVFEIEDNDEAARQVPMFGRGRIDHFGLQAASIEAFETIRERLMERGAADDFVIDFGQIFSLFFRDPDGLEGEVCVANPDAKPGVHSPPGTRAARYSS